MRRSLHERTADELVTQEIAAEKVRRSGQQDGTSGGHGFHPKMKDRSVGDPSPGSGTVAHRRVPLQEIIVVSQLQRTVQGQSSSPSRTRSDRCNKVGRCQGTLADRASCSNRNERPSPNGLIVVCTPRRSEYYQRILQPNRGPTPYSDVHTRRGCRQRRDCFPW
jgi:hypothetical protein